MPCIICTTTTNLGYMKRIVILTGAGISAESGIATFRGSGGLWNNYRIEDVASPNAWRRNPRLVLAFYNQRRADAAKAQPNAAHKALCELETHYQVHVITQNVDDLHERAGTTDVWHLHGKLREARSSDYPNLIYDIGAKPINLGDVCSKGSQLRPNIVWFGEEVPAISRAASLSAAADIFVVIGTSMQVYPAASLINYVPITTPKYIIDPHIPNLPAFRNIHAMQGKASVIVPQLVQQLLDAVQKKS